MRYEHLHADLVGLLTLINARRSPGLPELKLGALGWEKPTALHSKQPMTGGHAAAAPSAASLPQQQQPSVNTSLSWVELQQGLPSPPTTAGRAAATSGGPGPGSEGGGGRLHDTKYRTCGMECVDAVAAFYKKDLDLFGFSVNPDPG